MTDDTAATVDRRLVAPGDADRVAHVIQLVRRYADRPEPQDLTGLRIVDLGCRTGQFAVALHSLGATVHGIEGRAENFDRIAKTVVDEIERLQRVGQVAHFGDDRASFRLGDVRTLSTLLDGVFDVGLCLGILYHLDAQGAYNVLSRLRAVIPAGFVILDTHVANPALEPHTTVVQVYDPEPRAATYRGLPFGEVPSLWSGIEPGHDSWWFTEDDLETVCQDAGWSVSIIGPPNYSPGSNTNPHHPASAPNRVWWLLR